MTIIFLTIFVMMVVVIMVNGERTGNWAEEWVVGKVKMDGEDDIAHNEPNGGQWFQSSAEHSHPLSANMKAYAAWYMFARLAGWKILVGSIECSRLPGAAIPSKQTREPCK